MYIREPGILRVVVEASKFLSTSQHMYKKDNEVCRLEAGVSIRSKRIYKEVEF